jgi:hypothetical protein
MLNYLYVWYYLKGLLESISSTQKIFSDDFFGRNLDALSPDKDMI